jgi:tryptophanyl-tRNA synthetase
MKKRAFSGIQPTGSIHLGNYLGAIRHWVNSQREFNHILCIVDLHAITIPQDPVALRAKTRQLAALLFATGVDPELTSVFVQSHVSAHAELAWILNCFIPMGRMERMTQFKEKSGKLRQEASIGLFDYPALMAADILLYKTDIVHVGEDQKQHLELTRDVAKRFNSIYGDTFIIPEPAIPAKGARIMGLKDPTKKMSKSEEREDDAIYLLDTPDEIRGKIMRATTDSQRGIRYDESRPGLHNLLVIYEILSGNSREQIESHFSQKGYQDLKRELAELVVDHLRPSQERYHELSSDGAGIDLLLRQGASRVRPVAEETLATVKSKIGLG